MPAVSSTHSSPALCTQTGYSSFPSPTSINDGCSLSPSLCLNIHRQRCSSRSLNSLACLPARRTTHTYTHRYTHAHNPWGALAIQSVVFSIVLGSHTHTHTHTRRRLQAHNHGYTLIIYTHTEKTTHKKPESKRRLWQSCMKVCASDGGGEGDETQCHWTPRLSSLKGTVRHARKFPRIINFKKSIHVLTLNWIRDTTETAAGVIVSFERKRCLRLW